MCQKQDPKHDITRINVTLRSDDRLGLKKDSTMCGECLEMDECTIVGDINAYIPDARK